MVATGVFKTSQIDLHQQNAIFDIYRQYLILRTRLLRLRLTIRELRVCLILVFFLIKQLQNILE